MQPSNQFDFNLCALHGDMAGIDVFVAVAAIGQDPNLDPRFPGGDNEDGLTAVAASR